MERVIRRIAVLAISLLALQAGAEGDNTYDQRMLDVLLEQGAITRSQYEELSREASGKAAAAAAPAVSAEGEAPEGWKAYWKDGFRFERNDGLFKLKMGGRVQLDVAGITADDAMLMEYNVDGLRGIGTEFRRARLFMEGSFYEHGIFKAQYDFAGNDEVKFKDVFIGLRKLPGVGTVRAGHFKEAFSLDELTSSKYITFMERALPVEAFAPSRNTGIGFHDAVLDERMTWAVGGFRGDTPDGEARFEQGANYDVTARLTGLPVYANEGRQLVHLGFAYSHSFSDDGVRYRSRPEAHLSPVRFVDTGVVATQGVDTLGGEFAMVMGPFYAQAELIAALVDGGRNNPDPNFWGGYGQVSWFLTGENKKYKTSVGVFDRVKPKNRFSLKEGGWGAWELAARYSYLDLNDKGIRGGIQSDTTLGVNWYLYSNLRLMLNWVHAIENGVGEADIVESRVSLDF